MGFPGTSSRPASISSSFSTKVFTTELLSTPRTCSTKPLLTGWLYATMVSTSIAAAESGAAFLVSMARSITAAYAVWVHICQLSPSCCTQSALFCFSYQADSCFSAVSTVDSGASHACASRESVTGSPLANRTASNIRHSGDLVFLSIIIPRFCGFIP